MKRQAKQNIATSRVVNGHVLTDCKCNEDNCPICTWGAGICVSCNAAEIELEKPCQKSNAVTDIALSWIKERAEKQHATYKPADLNLREAWAEYLSYQHGEHWTPRQSYLVRRISALLG